MSGKFLHNFREGLTVRKERDIGIAQAVKAYLIAFSVYQFKSSYSLSTAHNECHYKSPPREKKTGLISPRLQRRRDY